MEYETVTSAAWWNAEKTAIRCDVKFSYYPQPLPFLAMASDVEAHGRQIFAELVAGEHGSIADYVPPASDAQDSGA